jgi:S-adenosylmethionine-diacylgycerolhomoserine-N-methlytransferase
MNTITLAKSTETVPKIQGYYSFHAYIYDATRWSFLFGRTEVIDKIPLLRYDVKEILEIGCGTGHNIIYLANRYPNATIIGVDISEDMIVKARENTAMYPNVIICEEIPSSVENRNRFDIILMSYVLTMMNPDWEYWINEANNLLNNKGYFAVVDFHTSVFSLFRRHMGNHHVRMEAHLLPQLKSKYKLFRCNIKKAYFGVWEYFIFIGKKK